MKEYLIAQGHANLRFDDKDGSMFANMVSNNASIMSSINSPASAGLKRMPLGSLKVMVPNKQLGNVLLSPMLIGRSKFESHH